MTDDYRPLVWIVAGLIVWFAIREVDPTIAGLILAAVVLGVLVKLGPQLARIPKN